MTRHIVVVDVETNGLDPDKHEVIEIAWWDLATDERGCYIPRHDVSRILAAAEVEALQVNRYIDRIAGAEQPDTFEAKRALRNALSGNTLAGANPTFDAAMLRKHLDGQPWHHRLFDLSAYAAGVLGLDELPGLARVCELLYVEPGDHTAEGDVRATVECFRHLMTIAKERKETAGV